jgi:quercetin dioxygenase-like cupin family protein
MELRHQARERAAEMTEGKSIVRADGEGERLRFWGGGVLTMKATAEETGGAFLLFEDSMARGKTTPLHIHAGEDEALYVLDGEILVHIDGADHAVRQGGLAVAPRGVPHAFLVTSETARVLTLQTPGSAEGFYRGASEPAPAGSDPSGPVDFARVREAADRSGGMEIVGPPPFAAADAGEAS